jgi:hypothetical protein
VQIGAVGYNRAAVDHVTLQKVVKQTVLHQVGPVAEKLFPRERREVFPHVPRMLGEHAAEGVCLRYLHISTLLFLNL